MKFFIIELFRLKMTILCQFSNILRTKIAIWNKKSHLSTKSKISDIRLMHLWKYLVSKVQVILPNWYRKISVWHSKLSNKIWKLDKSQRKTQFKPGLMWVPLYPVCSWKFTRLLYKLLGCVYTVRECLGF